VLEAHADVVQSFVDHRALLVGSAPEVEQPEHLARGLAQAASSEDALELAGGLVEAAARGRSCRRRRRGRPTRGRPVPAYR
jgi:hypothetical protein